MILNKDVSDNENNDDNSDNSNEFTERDDENIVINNKSKKDERKRKKISSKISNTNNCLLPIILIIILIIIVIFYSYSSLNSTTNESITLQGIQETKKIIKNKTEESNIPQNGSSSNINNNIENIQTIATTEIVKPDPELIKLNKNKEELMKVYLKEGQINIIKFYDEYINENTYNIPPLEQYNNIHINIGYNNSNIDNIILHLSSILFHSTSPSFLHIHMMNVYTFDYDSLIKLKNMIYSINNLTEIIVYNATDVLKDFYIKFDKVSTYAPEYAKLYAFKILKNIEKIIFYDADDCMTQKDLSELYNLNLDKIYARGINEIPDLRYPMSWIEKYLFDKSHYINGGVILINLKLCQEENFYDKAMVLNNEELFYTRTKEPAQDILNVLMRKKIDFFHPKFNKLNYYENSEDKDDETKWYSYMISNLKLGERNNHFYTKNELIEADNNPIIVHYAWDRYLNKNITKYEEEKNFFKNLIKNKIFFLTNL